MSSTIRHYHVGMGEQNSPTFRLFKFQEKAEAADLFLNLSKEIFDSYKDSDRITIEKNMYDALDNTNQVFYDGGGLFMSIVFGCNSESCMITTYN